MSKFRWTAMGTGGPMPVSNSSGGPEEMIGSVIAPQYAANQGNMRLAEYQYSKELEMWNKQNDYNSPANQMKRFTDAGVNPFAALGSTNSGNATQMPRYQAPTLQYDQKIPMVTNMLQTFADLDMKQAQTNKIAQEIKAVDYDNQLKAIQKNFWQKNENNKAQQLYNQGVITAREKDYIQKRHELDFDGIETVDSNGNYVWSYGKNSYEKQKRLHELGRYDRENQLLDERITSRKDFNKMYTTDKWIGWVMNILRMFK